MITVTNFEERVEGRPFIPVCERRVTLELSLEDARKYANPTAFVQKIEQALNNTSGTLKEGISIQTIHINEKEKVVVVDRTNEVTLISNYGKNSLVEVYVDEVPKELDGVKIKDAGLNDKYSITVGVIKRKDEYLFVDKNTIIQQGDKVTFIGPYKNIKVLFSNDEKEKSN